MSVQAEERQPQTGGRPTTPPPEDPFRLRTKVERFMGKEVTLSEPPLAEGLTLADSYFEMMMGEDRIMRLRIKEAEYIAEVCRRYVSPPIEVHRLPLRHYREVRRLVNVWEDFSGMGALRETLQQQATEAK